MPFCSLLHSRKRDEEESEKRFSVFRDDPRSFSPVFVFEVKKQKAYPVMRDVYVQSKGRTNVMVRKEEENGEHFLFVPQLTFTHCNQDILSATAKGSALHS
jgi:hypothetical protein